MKTITIDGITLTEAQVKEAMRRLQAPWPRRRAQHGDVLKQILEGKVYHYLLLDPVVVRQALEAMDRHAGEFICLSREDLGDCWWEANEDYAPGAEVTGEMVNLGPCNWTPVPCDN